MNAMHQIAFINIVVDFYAARLGFKIAKGYPLLVQAHNDKYVSK